MRLGELPILARAAVTVTSVAVVVAPIPHPHLPPESHCLSHIQIYLIITIGKANDGMSEWFPPASN